MENLVMSSRLSSYYRDKKVFITGHTGFKGGWLVACLHKLGAKVRGYALPPEFENGIFNIVQPSINAESILADIRDSERLKKEIKEFDPDIVIHLAAQPLVRRSYAIPAETFEVNVVGTANVLEAVSLLPGKCSVIVVTTDKVYKNKEKDVLYKEQDELGGYDPYSASKAASELVVSSFRDSFFNPGNYKQHRKAIASARAGNVIGGGDWCQDRIIPDIIRSLSNGERIPIRNPGAVRPWQHVLEPVYGYLLLGACLDKHPVKYSKAYNFGPRAKDHLSVKELVKLAIKFWGEGGWDDVSQQGQLHEAGNLKLDNSLAKKELHWKPKLKTKEAIDWTIKWYKQPRPYNSLYTFHQIEEYFAI